jgi:hypothetical protein
MSSESDGDAGRYEKGIDEKIWGDSLWKGSSSCVLA